MSSSGLGAGSTGLRHTPQTAPSALAAASASADSSEALSLVAHFVRDCVGHGVRTQVSCVCGGIGGRVVGMVEACVWLWSIDPPYLLCLHLLSFTHTTTPTQKSQLTKHSKHTNKPPTQTQLPKHNHHQNTPKYPKQVQAARLTLNNTTHNTYDPPKKKTNR